LVAIISNPVNSTVPIAAEIIEAAGMYDPKLLMGLLINPSHHSIA